MNSEEVNAYLAKIKGQSEEVSEPSTQETKETPQETPPAEVENKAEVKMDQEVPLTEKPDLGVEQKQDVKADDKAEEPKAEVKNDEPKVETEPKEPKKEEKKVTQRDYAFERLKRKSKEQHEKDLARIKELEEELAKGKGLKAEHFVNQDGTPNPNGYVDWKLKERDLQDEIKALQFKDRERQLQDDLEEDKRRVENCYSDPKERQEYDDLIARNGKAFYDAVSEVDPKGVVFGYLSTMPEYPIVLKELMTDRKLLGYTFRSTDPDALKHNIITVADQILDRHHNQISTPKVKAEQPKAPVETPKVEVKKELPVMGKQINNTANAASTVKDRNYWNRYLKEHPHG